MKPWPQTVVVCILSLNKCLRFSGAWRFAGARIPGAGSWDAAGPKTRLFIFALHSITYFRIRSLLFLDHVSVSITATISRRSRCYLQLCCCLILRSLNSTAWSSGCKLLIHRMIGVKTTVRRWDRPTDDSLSPMAPLCVTRKWNRNDHFTSADEMARDHARRLATVRGVSSVLCILTSSLLPNDNSIKRHHISVRPSAG